MPQMSKEYMADYYLKNKTKYQHKYKHSKHCETCDVVVTSHYWSRHVSTNRHKLNELKATGVAEDIDQPKVVDTVKRLRLEVKETLAHIKRLEHLVK